MNDQSVKDSEFEAAVARMRKHRPALRKRLKHSLTLEKLDDQRVIVGVKR